MSGKKLITLDHITLRVQDRFILPETTWEIKTNQNWAILGPNGSGKSALVGAIAGEVPVVRGRMIRHYPQTDNTLIGYVSFRLHQRILAQEENRDEARFFSGKWDTFETVRDTLMSDRVPDPASHLNLTRVLDLFEIHHLINRGIRFLSNGEMRKVLIARALMKSPRVLILDEPFEGLDRRSKSQLETSIIGLTDEGIQLILVTHRIEEITPNVSHILCLKDDKVFLQGERDRVLKALQTERLYDRKESGSLVLSKKPAENKDSEIQNPSILVEMKNATVKYGNLRVLDKLNWIIKQGENWAVVGPNGSGKTTLLNLIIGDNPQAYANEIYLFGLRKGSGESVWEIKKRIGIISSEFQIRYRKRMRAYDVILSGFFDSIGLYRNTEPSQQAVALEWTERMGIQVLAERRFDQLSDGEKRMVLLARSMVKSPMLLILDEPCQGLDPANRRLILDLIDDIGRNTSTNLLYVTHHQNEMLSCITHVLRLEKPSPCSSPSKGPQAYSVSAETMHCTGKGKKLD